MIHTRMLKFFTNTQVCRSVRTIWSEIGRSAPSALSRCWRIFNFRVHLRHFRSSLALVLVNIKIMYGIISVAVPTVPHLSNPKGTYFQLHKHREFVIKILRVLYYLFIRGERLWFLYEKFHHTTYTLGSNWIFLRFMWKVGPTFDLSRIRTEKLHQMREKERQRKINFISLISVCGRTKANETVFKRATFRLVICRQNLMISFAPFSFSNRRHEMVAWNQFVSTPYTVASVWGRG